MSRELRRLAATAGVALTRAESGAASQLLEAYAAVVEPFAAGEDDARPATRERQDGWARPAPGDDPLNAVLAAGRLGVPGCEGLLSGRRIGLKDNIALAGVPMTCGSALLADHVPRRDAIVAERALAAGGEVVAKLNMDAFGMSGGAETSDFGVIRNPVDPALTAGGSSGGCAAAVATGAVDVAYGTDQSGSIRVPASWCGVLGLKPTFGLVPYTGIVPVEVSYDHVGPLARTARDLALALDAVAGPHPSDPRTGALGPPGAVAAVDRAPDRLDGLTVGVVDEGLDAAEEATRHATLAVVDELAGLGARIVPVGLPDHRRSAAVMFAAVAEAQRQLMMAGGVVPGAAGHHAPELARALAVALRDGAADLPFSVKLMLLLGTRLAERGGGATYARALNAAAGIRAGVDRALRDADVLLMPTTPFCAHRHAPDATPAERVARGDAMLVNTGTFDVSGHPSLSIPAGLADRLPAGVMLTARHGHDARLLAIAQTFETAVGWRRGGQRR